MRLLVTGGAGFIGSNFIRYALTEHRGWEITNLDKLTYAGNLENLKDIQDQPGYHFVKGDIADRKMVDKLLGQGFDVIVNFAAESHVDRSILDASPFIETNVKGTQVLLEGAKNTAFKDLSRCLPMKSMAPLIAAALLRNHLCRPAAPIQPAKPLLTSYVVPTSRPTISPQLSPAVPTTSGHISFLRS
jgi:NAD(P)-dependent dehydrogenase (short-subunit alcohol dehydrogenase family)